MASIAGHGRGAGAATVPRGEVGGGVTKKTRLLIAADPDSMSGKAEKARKYGVAMLDALLVTTG